MSKKIRLERHNNSDYITIHQEGSLGILIHEGDLSFILKALEDEDYQNIFYSGRIGVTQIGRSLIMYNLVRGVETPCVVLTKAQSKRFVESVRTRLTDVLDSYTAYDR